MPEFIITSTQLIGICGFVTGIWAVWEIIKQIFKPTIDLRDKVKKHDQLLDNDNRRLREIEDSNKMVLQSLLVIINHDITGNGVEKMKETREELQDFLINKKTDHEQ